LQIDRKKIIKKNEITMKKIYDLGLIKSLLLTIIAFGGMATWGQNVAPMVSKSGVNGNTQEEAKNNITRSVYENGVVLDIMLDMYTFPYMMSPDGEHVVIQPFGFGDSYYWNSLSGELVDVPGSAYAVSADGTIAGAYIGEDHPGGATELAGTMNANLPYWEFLGINPFYPDWNLEYYSSAWGISDDGSTIVGMQWYDGWSTEAFKYIDGEYQMIGADLFGNSRATGISGNGETIYGWATLQTTGDRTPVGWIDDEAIYLAPNVAGEANCASQNGIYIAGVANDHAFIWTQEEGMTYFGDYTYNPTVINNDGQCFGFSGTFPPTTRVAFYRDVEGNLSSFNDYAEARGMIDAQDWVFYSINDASDDLTKFIGAGVNPDGVEVSFFIDFDGEAQAAMVNLLANPSDAGVVVGDGGFYVGDIITIEAYAMSDYVFMNWTNSEGEVVSTESIADITVTGDETYTANFQSTIGTVQNDEITVTTFPNPFNESLSINAKSIIDEVIIYDLFGRSINMVSSHSDKVVINTSDLKAGVYSLKVHCKNDIYFTKIIKE
jgi:hypothetical protein